MSVQPLPKPGSEMWDARFKNRFTAYGTEPNDFVRAVAPRLPDGPVLVIGAGEGRNAVHLASLGHPVTAVDLSWVGVQNTAKLAADRGLELETIHADLADYEIAEGKWAGIVSIWTHMPAELRKKVFASCVKGLAPGGMMVVEFYAPAHLDRPGKGGPPNPEMLLDVETAKRELDGLQFELLQQVERDVHEGEFHKGPSTTTQVLARKPG